MWDIKLLPCLVDDDDLALLVLSDINYPLPKMNAFEFEKYTDEFCWVHFRFYKADIVKLKLLLNIPETFICNNRVKVTGLEGLCILLKRLSYPNRYVDMMKIFPRTRCELSRIVNTVLAFMMQTHVHMLRNLSEELFSENNLTNYAEAIRDKGSPYDSCVGFIDGTVRSICRPIRNQRNYYNGHRRTHAIKFQSIILPNGIIGHMYGPADGRRHDAHLLEASGLIPQMERLFRGSNEKHFYLYGDPAYPLKRCLITPFKGCNLSRAQALCNRRMSSVRESVEWGFGKIVKIFAFLDFKKNLKLLMSPVSDYYLVGTFLTNCHTCLYGSQVSEYFNCAPPTLESYLLNGRQ